MEPRREAYVKRGLRGEVKGENPFLKYVRLDERDSERIDEYFEKNWKSVGERVYTHNDSGTSYKAEVNLKDIIFRHDAEHKIIYDLEVIIEIFPPTSKIPSNLKDKLDEENLRQYF